MNRTRIAVALDRIPPFDRDFFGSPQIVSRIGDGELGGKATGLAFVGDVLTERFGARTDDPIRVGIPRMAVVTTSVFERFIDKNKLHQLRLDELSDDDIAHEFLRAELPAEMVGDLHALIASVRTPLAVRSSSLLEDALQGPLAGVYATKMIPNNDFDVSVRFRRLTEAIKLVFASTWLSGARRYREHAGLPRDDERMAAIIQEVVGRRFGQRFYPHLSGIARSCGFYPIGPAKPSDGVVYLALGLGKQIVDGGISWQYSPKYPKLAPPVGSPRELLSLTQTEFWAVTMTRPEEYDPLRETEYMVRNSLVEAEEDGSLPFLVSTYRPHDDRLWPGTGPDGPRCLTFAPILQDRAIPLNDYIVELMQMCQDRLASDVEIEFAMTLSDDEAEPASLNLLQVRPMATSQEEVSIEPSELHGDRTLVSSDRVLGNGVLEGIHDIVYVRPDTFEAKHTPAIARDLTLIDRELVAQGRRYLLVGFGRWGSSDPWLGIPVQWDQISGAAVVVEATQPGMDVELSQGAHFFHNLSAFHISYFMVRHGTDFGINWDWLDNQSRVSETEHVRHVRTEAALTVRVDGRTGLGVILI